MPENNLKGNSHWTAEHDAELRRLAGEGISYRNIAEAINEKFGTVYSRNAAIGRSGRLGIAKESAPCKPGPRRKRQLATSRLVRVPHNSNVVRAKPMQEMEKLRCVEIVPRGLTLLELESGDCRYPYGDGSFTFCGHPIKDGSSFCVPHHALCFDPPRAKIDKWFRRAA